MTDKSNINEYAAEKAKLLLIGNHIKRMSLYVRLNIEAHINAFKLVNQDLSPWIVGVKGVRAPLTSIKRLSLCKKNYCYPLFFSTILCFLLH